MFRTVIAMFALGLCSGAMAQITTYADVKANGGVKLSGADLNDLLPGAKVVSRTQAGSTRTWQNKLNGTLSASTDGRGFAGGKNNYATAEGTWKVNENGRWCVSIKWPVSADDWCRVMYKVGNKYCGVGRLDDAALASEFEISK
jgi:hypothetical protein